MSITVKALRERKEQLDAEVLAAIKSFEADTGTHVTSMQTLEDQHIGKRHPRVVAVDMEVVL